MKTINCSKVAIAWQNKKVLFFIHQHSLDHRAKNVNTKMNTLYTVSLLQQKNSKDKKWQANYRENVQGSLGYQNLNALYVQKSIW